MRPPRSNAWRPQGEGKRLLDPSTPTPSTHSPPFPPPHPQLTNSPHELLAHLLEPGLLHRREIARHLAIFILLDLQHLGPAGLHPVHQLPEAVTVGRHARLHLILDTAASLHLLLHQRAPARAEALLRGTQLRRLIGRQLQILLYAVTEAPLYLPAETPRLGGVALRAHAISLLCCQTRRKQDGKAE